MNKYLSTACIVLCIVCVSLFNWGSNQKKEKSRLAGNQTALMKQVSLYQTEAGKSAASVQALTLSKEELEKYCSELTNAVDELNVKVKRLQSASTTATETKVKVKTIIKDSIVYRNAAFDTIQAIEWKDKWVRITGEIYKKNLRLDICSTDTLRQIVHRVPKKFLFIKYGTKAIRQEIVSTNPHTKIVYSKYIELKK